MKGNTERIRIQKLVSNIRISSYHSSSSVCLLIIWYAHQSSVCLSLICFAYNSCLSCSMMEIIERYRKCTAEKKLPSNQSNVCEQKKTHMIMGFLFNSSDPPVELKIWIRVFQDGSAQGVKSLQRTVEAVQSTCK